MQHGLIYVTFWFSTLCDYVQKWEERFVSFSALSAQPGEAPAFKSALGKNIYYMKLDQAEELIFNDLFQSKKSINPNDKSVKCCSSQNIII